MASTLLTRLIFNHELEVGQICPVGIAGSACQAQVSADRPAITVLDIGSSVSWALLEGEIARLTRLEASTNYPSSDQSSVRKDVSDEPTSHDEVGQARQEG